MRLEELYGFDARMLASYKCLGYRPPEFSALVWNCAFLAMLTSTQVKPATLTSVHLTDIRVMASGSIFIKIHCDTIPEYSETCGEARPGV